MAHGTFWSECKAPDATTDRGWLKAECDAWDYSRHSEYTSETMPVLDDDTGIWREQSTLGNYLDYGPCRPYASGPQVHCICYASQTTCYVNTVEQAREWIESEAYRVRPDLTFQRSLLMA